MDRASLDTFKDIQAVFSSVGRNISEYLEAENTDLNLAEILLDKAVHFCSVCDRFSDVLIDLSGDDYDEMIDALEEPRDVIASLQMELIRRVKDLGGNANAMFAKSVNKHCD